MRRILTKTIIHLVLARKILHNEFPISPGYYNRPKKNRIRSLCKILGGKQGALGNVKMVNSFSEDLILIVS